MGKRSAREWDASLEDSYASERQFAAEKLRKLEPAALAKHIEAVISRLDDSYWGVRLKALVELSHLDPASLAKHANSVVARLGDTDWSPPTLTSL